MQEEVVTAPAHEPRFKSTPPAPFAAGFHPAHPQRDGSVLAAFVAGVLLCAAAFLAVAPFVARH